MNGPSRRTFLGGLAATGLAASTVALAGCLGDDDDGENEDTTETDWQEIVQEDVTTGEEFTIAEADTPVVIHTFATYCPTCGSQQNEIADGYESLQEQATFLDLTVDENDEPRDIRDHAEANGFDWKFGIAPSDLTSQLVDEFGQQVTVPPQSPLIIVCPDGTANTIEKVSDPTAIEDALETYCS